MVKQQHGPSRKGCTSKQPSAQQGSTKFVLLLHFCEAQQQVWWPSSHQSRCACHQCAAEPHRRARVEGIWCSSAVLGASKYSLYMLLLNYSSCPRWPVAKFILLGTGSDNCCSGNVVSCEGLRHHRWFSELQRAEMLTNPGELSFR